jgi:hypothetical protein
MRRLAGLAALLFLCACAREPESDPLGPSDRDADHVAQDADVGAGDASHVDGVPLDLGPDVDSAVTEPPDVPPVPDSSDSTRPSLDVGRSDVAMSDAIDVGRPLDVRVSDRCGSLSRAHMLLRVEALAADDAGDVAVDVRSADVADAVADRRVDGDVRDATLDDICRALKVEFRTFAQMNNVCTPMTGCMIVTGTRACDCGRIGNLGQGIGDGSGTPVSATARAEAQTFIDRWNAAGCEQWDGFCVSDARPATMAECRDGHCWSDLPSCLVPPPPPPEPCH